MTGSSDFRAVRASFLKTAMLILSLSLIFAPFMPSTAFAQEPEPTVDPASYSGLVPLANIKQVSAGRDHTCALTLSGGAKCWGGDAKGQIGDGADVNDKNTPVDVVGLTSGVLFISAGYEHSCALTTAGGVKCWGSDESGQLGDGVGNTDKDAPVNVAGLTSGVKAISAGGFFTCALTTGGGVKCWGNGSSGKLGNGDTSNMPTPVDVTGLTTGVQAISAGYGQACALTTGGGVKCWGYGEFGSLGNGGVVPGAPSSSTPVDVTGLSSGVVAISSGGYQVCALLTGGAVKCWGQGGSGELGNGMGTPQSTPVDVIGFASGAQSVSAGNDHSCALTTSGALKCWGSRYYGQVGDGTTGSGSPQYTPFDVVGLSTGVQSVEAGVHHTCAVLIGGRLKCWGGDDEGQVGDGDYTPDKGSPVDVMVLATCFRLTLARTPSGGGAVPAVVSDPSPDCQPGHYLRNARILVQAAPATDYRVQGWSAPIASGAGEALVSFAMPAADTTVTVTYAPCYALTRSHSGSGGNPVASPAQSVGCAGGKYAQGESIVLTALPNANQRVKSWSGTTGTPAVGSQVNSVTMPAANKTVSVAYEACNAVALSVVGGGELVTSPVASDGCLTGGYAAGQQVTFVANAAPGWRVAGWAGTQNNNSKGDTNTTVVSEGGSAVGVIFERVVYLPTVGR